MRLNKLIAILVLSGAACASHAGSTETALLSYTVVKAKIGLCRSKAGMVFILSSHNKPWKESYSEYLQCQDEAKKLAKDAYDGSLKSLKKPKARAALKEYQVAVTTAISSMDSREGEIERITMLRQQALDEQMEKAWQRLQIEL